MRKKSVETGRPRAFAEHAAVATCALVLAAATAAIVAADSHSIVDSKHGSGELVFVTEDRALSIPGCDAISVFEIDETAPLHQGSTRVSPGRLASTSDQSLVIAGASQSGQLYALYRDSSESGWRDTNLSSSPPATYFGDIGFAQQDRALLVATGLSPRCIPAPDTPYEYFVSKFLVDEIDLGEGSLGPEIARVSLPGPAAQIIVADEGRIAHIVAVPYRTGAGSLAVPTVVTVDVETMIEVAARIPLASIGTRQTTCRRAFVPIGVTHATISPDENVLVTNRWEGGGLNVADLVARRATTIDIGLPRGSWVGGVSFSHGESNHGALVIHAIRSVRVYDWIDPSTIALRASAPVPAPVELRDGVILGNNSVDSGPVAAVEWSWSGESVIAAISMSGSSEFRSWSVDPSESFMRELLDYEACTATTQNRPNDILTGNRVLPTSTPLPSLTPSATTSPSATPTATAISPSATVPPSASPMPSSTSAPSLTPVLTPIYLPISLTERCDPTHVRANVALILDASTSMTGEKLDAAKAAAVAFIRAMRLPEDRVGVAAFNRDARVVHTLSGNAAELVAAIEAIDVAPGTRIDRGLDAGREILAGARAIDGVTPVLVLLTDGIQEAEIERPVEVALSARGAGIDLHVVGLGADVDADYLRDVAGSPDRLHLSPDPAELEAIYADIARSIPCPVDSYWGRRSSSGARARRASPARIRAIGLGRDRSTPGSSRPPPPARLALTGTDK